jgi:transposase
MMLEKGYTTREIAAKVGCKSHTTIVRLKKKYEETGNVQNKHNSGRSRKLNERDERNIVRSIMTRECSNAVQIQKSLKVNDNIEVSSSTVRRALKRNGLAARVKRKKPLLSKKHREKRLNFAKRYKNWTVSDWNKVVWSDESKFQIFGSDGRQYCWKRPKDPLQDAHVKPTVKFGGGSIFVWGCFTSSGVGYLVRIEGGLDAELYCKILEEDLMDTLHYYDLDTNNVIFQQDNDPKHTAARTKQWFEDNEIEVLSWPPQSPDLNPIEHLWNDIDRRLRASEIEIRGKDMLWEQVSKVWNETALEACSKLIETMPERINDVIKAKEGYTRW